MNESKKTYSTERRAAYHQTKYIENQTQLVKKTNTRNKPDKTVGKQENHGA